MRKCCCQCSNRAVIKCSKDGSVVCKDCFIELFEQNVHETVTTEKQFAVGDTIAIGVSGGKDSTVLAYVLNILNKRYNYGIRLVMVAVDEGIKGYRDDSLKAVERNQSDYGIPLKVLSYKDLYGWTMDEIAAKVGKKNNCTFCGVFRRQALERGALMVGANKLATGHNADDVAETVLLNMLRGDIARLKRSATVSSMDNSLPRIKPLRKSFEKEIVMYAHYQKLAYFSTECFYAPNAYRGYVREYVKELARIEPQTLLNLIYSGENLDIREEVMLPALTTCERCGFQSSSKLCKACLLLQGLNSDNPNLGIKKKKGREREVDNSSHCEAKNCLCEPRSAELF